MPCYNTMRLILFFLLLVCSRLTTVIRAKPADPGPFAASAALHNQYRKYNRLHSSAAPIWSSHNTLNVQRLMQSNSVFKDCSAVNTYINQTGNTGIDGQQEADLLMAFKVGITDDPGLCLASWNYNTSDAQAGMLNGSSTTNVFCSWKGISCSNVTSTLSPIRHVVGLNLSNCNLSGTISPSLASLSALSILDLSYNNFSGVLHESLFLPNCSLTFLRLSYNNLQGNIPSSLPQNCKQLETLRLYNTGLSGPIPSGIWSQLPRLLQLSISSDTSQLSVASFPSTFTFCSTIKYLALDGFNATGASFPQALGDCRALEVLSINVAGLEGVIPDSIWQLPNLVELLIQDVDVVEYVYNNPVLPDSRPYKMDAFMPQQQSVFGFCNTIQFISIDGINLTGEIPSSLGNCNSLYAINLSHGNLQGSIPAALGKLTSLKTLYLEANNLTQGIPAALSSCTQLVYLRLGFNPLSGSIPKEIGMLSQLQVFSAYTANLGGTMPPEICNCSQLVWLDVGWQAELYSSFVDLSDGIAGGVPQCFATHLTNLQTLSWTLNPINGDIPIGIIGNLTKLQNIQFSYCNISGNVPSQLGNLTQLQHLEFTGNSLRGPIPYEISLLPNLEILFLDNNRLINGTLNEEFIQGLVVANKITKLHLSTNSLQGVIPLSLCSIATLQSLRLQVNNFKGSINSCFGDMVNLLELDLGSNNLSGTIPPSLGHLTKLNNLNLSNNDLEGNIPSSFGGLVNVNNLVLSNNQLFGNIPHELGILTGLQTLDLSNNYLEGYIPINAIQNLTSLKTLRLYKNHLSGEIEDLDISKMSQLQTFALHVNKLHGALPTTLTQSNSLVIIDVGNNNFSGSLPNINGTQIIGLSNLRVLALGYNQLTKDIPGWIWRLSTLQALDLSNNEFIGYLPTTIAQLAYFKLSQNASRNQTTLYEEVPVTLKNSLVVLNYVLSTRIYFDVSMNKLQGDIPESFGELKGITGINLSHNSFKGTIPKSIGKLEDLEVLDLSHNHLIGPIPQELTSLSMSTFDVSYNELEGTIPTKNGFNTRFASSSFKGNPHLCGYPLITPCNSKTTTEDNIGSSSPSIGSKIMNWMNAFIDPWGLFIGYVVGLVGGFCGYYMFLYQKETNMLVDALI